MIQPTKSDEDGTVEVTDDTDEPFKPIKKRRHVEKPKWKVRVGAVCGDGLVDDGYSWRKYGQKEILGSKYPRAYCRCTHRNSQGCAAMKQVQRCDDDPMVFDVIYLGTHTCIQSAVAMQLPLEPLSGMRAHLGIQAPPPPCIPKHHGYLLPFPSL
ncbi:unnamed protein product [Urochloa humidicola]